MPSVSRKCALGPHERQKRGFQLPLLRRCAQTQKVKDVRVLQHLPRQLRMRRGQRPPEIGHGPPLPVVQAALHLRHQHVAAPAIFDSLADIPKALGRVFHLIEQDAVMAPRQVVQQLLHNCLLGPRRRERPHIL